MGRPGLLIGEIAARSGVSRKGLRLYEAAGILPRAARTAARYRLYGDEVLPLLQFVTQARRLGFSLAEIKEILAIKHSGQVPCPHVKASVRSKIADLDRTLRDLMALRDSLRRVLSSRPAPGDSAAVCPHIEQPDRARRRNRDGQPESVALSRM